MATAPSRHLSVRIERPFDEAYAVLADPLSWPAWASGLGDGLTRLADGDYALRAADGAGVRVRFSPPNPAGVLDHTVFLPDGQVVPVPLRLIRNGDGCEAVFTLLRTPAMTDEGFAADAAWVERDLAALKALLEQGPPPR